MSLSMRTRAVGHRLAEQPRLVGPVQGDLAVAGPEGLVDLGVAGEPERPGAVGAGRDLRGPELHGHTRTGRSGVGVPSPDPDPEGAAPCGGPEQAGRARGQVDHHLVGHRPDPDLVALDREPLEPLGRRGSRTLSQVSPVAVRRASVDQERRRASPGQLLGDTPRRRRPCRWAGTGRSRPCAGQGDIGRGVAELEHTRPLGTPWWSRSGRPGRGVEQGRGGRPASPARRSRPGAQDGREQGGDGSERAGGAGPQLWTFAGPSYGLPALDAPVTSSGAAPPAGAGRRAGRRPAGAQNSALRAVQVEPGVSPTETPRRRTRLLDPPPGWPGAAAAPPGRSGRPESRSPAQPTRPEDLVGVDRPDAGHETAGSGEQGPAAGYPGPAAGPQEPARPGRRPAGRWPRRQRRPAPPARPGRPGTAQPVRSPQVEERAGRRRPRSWARASVWRPPGRAAARRQAPVGPRSTTQAGRLRGRRRGRAGGRFPGRAALPSLAADEPVGELLAVAVAARPGPPHLDRLDLPAADLLVEVLAEGLDLRQLGHQAPPAGRLALARASPGRNAGDSSHPSACELSLGAARTRRRSARMRPPVAGRAVGGLAVAHPDRADGCRRGRSRRPPARA